MEEQKEVIQIEKRMKQFVVVGLGRFGRSLATTLADLGNEVLAIDTDPEAVKKVDGFVSNAVVADAKGTDVLHSLGVQNFDCVVNCIGDDLQASILVTLICKELGVKFVVAKAQNDQNKKILEKVGADMVVFPEVYMGRKIANMLSNPSMNELLNLTEKIKIAEMPTPDDWQDKSLVEIDARKKYKTSVIFIKRNDEIIYPEATSVLQKGDILIVAGETGKLQILSNKTSEVIDVAHSLHDALESD